MPGDPPPNRPPAGPAEPGGSSAVSSGRPHRPWWRRSGVVAPVAGAAALATVLAVVLTNQPADRSRSQPSAGGTDSVSLQPADAQGPVPFTPSFARTDAPAPTTEAGRAPGTAAAPDGSGSGAGQPASTWPAQGGSRSVQGSAAGLYGGTQQLSSCDVARLSDYLAQNPDKARAWAGTEGVPRQSLTGYLRSLTPVVLRMDTGITDYGFANGSATPFPAVLQAGTAVLIDARGLPRARCACGNPLLPPTPGNAAATAAAGATSVGAAGGVQTFTGSAWSSFRPGNVVVVNQSVTQVNVVVLYDAGQRAWFQRPVGGRGHDDHRVPPPPGAWRPGGLPSTSWSAAASGSASGSTSGSGAAPASASHTPSHSPSHTPSHSASHSASVPPSVPPSQSPAQSRGPSKAPASSRPPSSSASSAPSSGSPSQSSAPPSTSASSVAPSVAPSGSGGASRSAGRPGPSSPSSSAGLPPSPAEPPPEVSPS